MKIIHLEPMSPTKSNANKFQQNLYYLTAPLSNNVHLQCFLDVRSNSIHVALLNYTYAYIVRSF